MAKTDLLAIASSGSRALRNAKRTSAQPRIQAYREAGWHSKKDDVAYANALRAATRVDPTYADAWYNLSDLLDEQGRIEAAIECLRTALRVAPDYADAMFNLALLLQRQNQYADAADYWRRYLASDCQWNGVHGRADR
jgi:tetratricopeptide (TPR) repeat protein